MPSYQYEVNFPHAKSVLPVMAISKWSPQFYLDHELFQPSVSSFPVEEGVVSEWLGKHLAFSGGQLTTHEHAETDVIHFIPYGLLINIFCDTCLLLLLNTIVSSAAYDSIYIPSSENCNRLSSSYLDIYLLCHQHV